jgi:hypothetical protein
MVINTQKRHCFIRYFWVKQVGNSYKTNPFFGIRLFGIETLEIMPNSCALCKKEKPLQISHIVPSFVGKWLKESSASGFMRELRAPNERIQDVWKTQLLCRDCKGITFRLETYLAKEIFYPYLEGKNKPLNYDDRFLRFAVSQSWRLLCSTMIILKRIILNSCNIAQKQKNHEETICLDVL